MSIRVRCAKCGKQYKVKEQLAGKAVKCSCGARMRIPALTSQPSAPKPASAPPPAPAESNPLADLVALGDQGTGGGGVDFMQSQSALPNLQPAPTTRKRGSNKKLLVIGGVVGAVFLFAVGLTVVAVVVMQSSRSGSPGASPQAVQSLPPDANNVPDRPNVPDKRASISARDNKPVDLTPVKSYHSGADFTLPESMTGPSGGTLPKPVDPHLGYADGYMFKIPDDMEHTSLRKRHDDDVSFVTKAAPSGNMRVIVAPAGSVNVSYGQLSGGFGPGRYVALPPGIADTFSAGGISFKRTRREDGGHTSYVGVDGDRMVIITASSANPKRMNAFETVIRSIRKATNAEGEAVRHFVQQAVPEWERESRKRKYENSQFETLKRNSPYPSPQELAMVPTLLAADGVLLDDYMAIDPDGLLAIRPPQGWTIKRIGGELTVWLGADADTTFRVRVTERRERKISQSWASGNNQVNVNGLGFSGGQSKTFDRKKWRFSYTAYVGIYKTAIVDGTSSDEAGIHVMLASMTSLKNADRAAQSRYASAIKNYTALIDTMVAEMPPLDRAPVIKPVTSPAAQPGDWVKFNDEYVIRAPKDMPVLSGSNTSVVWGTDGHIFGASIMGGKRTYQWPYTYVPTAIGQDNDPPDPLVTELGASRTYGRLGDQPVVILELSRDDMWWVMYLVGDPKGNICRVGGRLNGANRTEANKAVIHAAARSISTYSPPDHADATPVQELKPPPAE